MDRAATNRHGTSSTDEFVGTGGATCADSKRAECTTVSPAPTVRFQAKPGARPPEYASPGSAGADLRAYLDGRVVFEPGERIIIPTGLTLEIPVGWEGQVRPRSGLAAKHGITVLNSPGTIDSDYRGEVKVILINTGTESFIVEHGDRIAQLIITPVHRATFRTAETLAPTKRGGGGFGSTGVSD